MKIFKLGLIVGRFQLLHLGHIEVIKEALKHCKRVILFVGSSQEDHTKKNPFTYEERVANLRRVFKTKKLIILPLPDAGIGNNSLWGAYILSKVPEELGTPDAYFSGSEAVRQDWFDEDEIWHIILLKTNDISSTKMQEFILSDKKESWQENTDKKLWGQYDFIKERISEVQENKDTKSI